MSNNTIPGLASIIVPCWGQLEFTAQCIAALRRHTRMPWELIAIDNGSTDHTATYLAGVRDLAAVPVTIVSNATNLGCPAAINQGLRLARGEYLVMLNNDVVVTDAWLDQLIALANAKPRGRSVGVGSGEWGERQGVWSGWWRAGGRSDRSRFPRGGREQGHRPRRADVELRGAAAVG